jgi:hypothetical protein
MTEENLQPTIDPDLGVQRDSETPLPQKPSFLFLVATSVGVLVILLLIFGSYYGVAR